MRRAPRCGLGDTIRALARHLPARLSASAGADRVVEATDALPAPIARELYLECRLNASDSRVDAIAGVSLSRLALLHGSLIAMPPAARWPHLSELCRRLADPGNHLLTLVDRLWLEFDTPASSGTDGAEPGVFLHARHATRRDSAELAQIVELVAAGSVHRSDALDRVVRSLPDAATVHYVGRMYSRRDADAIRLCIGGVRPREWIAWLRRHHWQGSVDLLAHGVELFASRAGAASPTPGLLHLDIDGGLGPRVGIEFVLERRAQARGGFMDADLLRRLVAAGLCAEDKAAALRAWPGCSTEWLHHHVAPSVWARRVNHIKLTVANAGAEAKAYLYGAGYTRAAGTLVRA